MKRKRLEQPDPGVARRRFLLALRELDEAWVETFHKSGSWDVYFSRLFTEL